MDSFIERHGLNRRSFTDKRNSQGMKSRLAICFISYAMNKLTALILRGADRLNLRPLLAAKSETSKRLPPLRFVLRNREPQAPKAYIVAARVAVVLVGLLFAANGALLLSAGCVGGSWGLIVLGVLAVPTSLLIGWSGLTPPRGGFCNAPVAFAAELLYRVVGNGPAE